MCGIAGFVGRGELEQTADVILGHMTDAITHRGPNDCGAWLDRTAGVALGHRRLSIIDLTAAGHQPMRSHDGRYVIAFNGEIYNFPDLRAELEQSGRAPAWVGRSDTEVLLAAISAWGVAAALSRTHGMFAFALWDRRERLLTLCRDRMGEKPLYYGWQGDGPTRQLLFGSDMAALKAHPAFAADVDRQAVGLLVRYLYIPDPYTAYQGFRKVMPGTIVTIDPRSGRSTTTPYWDTLAEAAKAQSNRFDGSPEEAVERLAQLLGAAVERQMTSDVPLGAFLSGGVDSSTVVALMQARSSRPVRTFTIGFEEAGYNEAGHAGAVAKHLGVDHTELVVTPADALRVIPDLPSMYSEPFADSSQIPTFLVSKLARRSVTVALSGDGGDELFGGYGRHRLAQRYWPRLSSMPRRPRLLAAQGLRSLAPAAGERLHKAAAVLASASLAELYRNLVSINRAPDLVLAEPVSINDFADRALSKLAGLGGAEAMMALDAAHYLPGDILTKLDRAAMATSLETRVPMLDPQVVAFAWSLPIGLKLRAGTTKWPLRQVLYRHVPRSLIERSKMGFEAPIGPWLRGPLRAWGEAILEERALAAGELFDVAQVRRLWADHQQDAGNNQHRLWPILMAQAWLADGAATAAPPTDKSPQALRHASQRAERSI